MWPVGRGEVADAQAATLAQAAKAVETFTELWSLYQPSMNPAEQRIRTRLDELLKEIASRLLPEEQKGEDWTMGLPKKRGKVYYANTRVNGVHLRDCLNTDNWQEAQQKQAELVEKALQGKIQQGPVQREWLKLTVAEALDALVEVQIEAGREDGTIRIYRERSVPLKRLLGTMRVAKITAETIRWYQSTRRTEGVKGRTINMEVGCIRAILKKAKRWARIEDDVETQSEQRDVIPVALQEGQKERLFEAAASNERWSRARYCGMIAVNTTARKCEVLRARYQDVNLFTGEWIIPKGKTNASIRTIALNDEARDAFIHMMELGRALGGGEPEHYIFCACEHNHFDFTKYQKSVRTAWRKLRDKAGLNGYRIHDLRHQAITEMAENDVPESVMESIAGHVSKKMREHYTHIRTNAKQKAVSALGTGVTAKHTGLKLVGGKKGKG
jgi:integrase